MNNQVKVHQHTELPIIYAPSYAQGVDGCYDLISNPDTNTFMYVGEINKEVDAAFIVKACNNHYELLSALKVALEHIGTVYDSQGKGCAIAMAKAAIKQAEAEQ